MTFNVIIGLLISSIKYKICSDGNAINIKIIAGINVQINSIVCSSNKNRLINLFLVIEIII